MNSYSIVFVPTEGEPGTKIGECEEYKDAFKIMSTYMKNVLHTEPGHYRSFNVEKYIKLINGKYIFHLYKN